MVKRLASLMLLLVPIISCCDYNTKYRRAIPEVIVRPDNRELMTDFYASRIPEVILPAPIQISPSAVRSGGRIFLKVTYTVSGLERGKSYPLTQIVSVIGQGQNTELLRRRIENVPGTHISYLRITLPKDSEPGQYVIISRFIAGDREASAKGVFRILQPQSRRP